MARAQNPGHVAFMTRSNERFSHEELTFSSAAASRGFNVGLAGLVGQVSGGYVEERGDCGPKVEAWGLRLEDIRVDELDRSDLECLGKVLDHHPASLHGPTVGVALAERLLVVRTREGRPGKLKANKVQKAFENKRGQRNIVLKARQMGLTTWVAARFFLKTITQPGTLTLEVAHTQEAAEEIFRQNPDLSVMRFDDATDDGAVAGRRGGYPGGFARSHGAGRRADSGVDAAGSGRMLLRGVAQGR